MMKKNPYSKGSKVISSPKKTKKPVAKAFTGGMMKAAPQAADGMARAAQATGGMMKPVARAFTGGMMKKKAGGMANAAAGMGRAPAQAAGGMAKAAGGMAKGMAKAAGAGRGNAGGAMRGLDRAAAMSGRTFGNKKPV
jgi:hypothetical protein